MKKELFCEIMENVDKKYIKEYYEKRFTTRSQRIKKYVLATGMYAAAILVVAVAIPFIIRGSIEPTPSVNPKPPVTTETAVTTEEPQTDPEDMYTDTLEIDWVFENFYWGEQIYINPMEMTFDLPNHLVNMYPADDYSDTTYERYDEDGKLYRRGFELGPVFKVTPDYVMDAKIWEYCTPVDLDNIESSGASDLSNTPVTTGTTANGYDYVEYKSTDSDTLGVHAYVRIADDMILEFKYLDDLEAASFYERFLDSIKVTQTDNHGLTETVETND